MLPLLLAAFAFADGAAPAPEPLIEKAMAMRKAQDAKEWKFTWREELEQRDEKGRALKPFRRTFDVIMLEGQSYRKLVLLDAVQLDEKTLKRVEEGLEKERELRRKHQFMNQTISFGALEELERLFGNKVAGEDFIGGRRAWRVESEPRQGVKAASPKEEEILATRRVTWFDDEEGLELRRRTAYTRRVHNIQVGTHEEIEWSKVGDAWLPSTHYFHGEISPFPGFRSFGDARSRYSDYKRFAAESTFIPN